MSYENQITDPQSSPSSGNDSPSDHSFLYKFFAYGSLLSAILSFPLIGLGAIVRLKGAGLACPDWPLCYGRVTPITEVVSPPPEGFKIALEVGHRYWAGLLGLFVLALWGISFRWRNDKALKPLFWCAGVSVLFLIPQAVLGGLTVLMDLRPITVASHLLLGHVFFGALIVQTLWGFSKLDSPTGHWFNQLANQVNTKVSRRWITGAFVLLILQIFVGGWVSSTHAGMACPDFPTCFGSFAFPDGWGPGIQYTHRFVGFSLAIALIGMTVRVIQQSQSLALKYLSITTILLVIGQILVGWYNVEYYIPVPTSALHTIIATMLFAVMTVLTFGSWFPVESIVSGDK